MSTFFTDMKKSISMRFSGELSQEINKRIAEIRKYLEVIDELQAAHSQTSDFWLEWFMDCQKTQLSAELKFIKKVRFIPAQIMGDDNAAANKIYERYMGQLMENGKPKLKDIILPLPRDKSFANAFFHVMLGCLPSYLLEDADEDI